MFPILADAEAEPSIIIGLTAITMLVAMFSLLFFVRRLQHKEIMAAIEKGIPLPTKPTTTKGPRWITNISIGVGFLIISLAFLVDFFIGLIHNRITGDFPVFVFLFGIGAAFLVRGLLQRKFQQ